MDYQQLPEALKEVSIEDNRTIRMSELLDFVFKLEIELF